jgi:hypothetical protein
VRRAKKGTGSGTSAASVSRIQTEQSTLEDDPEDVPAAQPRSVAELTEKPDKVSTPEAKTGPPTLGDWQDFFGRIVIRALVNGYIALQLSDFIDELTPSESKAIFLSKEDMAELAAPLASLSAKSSFMKKHGRFIISTTDSYESLVTLFFWMRRVNRIASRHRKFHNPPQPVVGVAQPKKEKNDAQSNGHDRGSDEVNGQPRIPVFNPGTG